MRAGRPAPQPTPRPPRPLLDKREKSTNQNPGPQPVLIGHRASSFQGPPESSDLNKASGEEKRPQGSFTQI